MAKIQDVDIPHLEFAEAAAPGTPAAGIVRIYAKADGLMYSKDDAGVETAVSGGGGLTDPMTTRGDVIIRNASNVTARLAIGSTGKVLQSDGTDISWQTPAPVAVGARVKRTTTQTITTATTTNIGFTAEDWDSDAFHDNSTNNSRLTVPTGKAGTYLITATVEWDVGGGNTGFRQINVNLNGATNIAMVNQGGTASEYTRQHISTIYRLIAGDYVELQGYHTRGSNLDVTVVVPTTFALALLGT